MAIRTVNNSLTPFMLLLCAAGDLSRVENVLEGTGLSFPRAQLNDVKDWILAQCNALQNDAYGELDTHLSSQCDERQAG